MAALDDLRAAVARERTVNSSAIALLQGLSDKISALATLPAPIDPQALTDLANQIDNSTNALANAVTANTQSPGVQGNPGGIAAAGQAAAPPPNADPSSFAGLEPKADPASQDGSGDQVQKPQPLAGTGAAVS